MRSTYGCVRIEHCQVLVAGHILITHRSKKLVMQIYIVGPRYKVILVTQEYDFIVYLLEINYSILCLGIHVLMCSHGKAATNDQTYVLAYKKNGV